MPSIIYTDPYHDKNEKDRDSNDKVPKSFKQKVMEKLIKWSVFFHVKK